MKRRTEQEMRVYIKIQVQCDAYCLRSSSTQSVTNSVWTFYKENGRTYHGYRAGSKYLYYVLCNLAQSR